MATLGTLTAPFPVQARAPQPISCCSQWVFPSGVRTDVPTVASWTSAYSEEEIRDALACARRLGLRPVGGNYKTLHRHLEYYAIAIDHLGPNWTRRSGFRHAPRPLSEILAEHLTYNRGKVKSRLYDAGIKQRRCELCGQSELWRDMPMPLIIDHINGVGDDNRIENLQIGVPQLRSDTRHSLWSKDPDLF